LGLVGANAPNAIRCLVLRMLAELLCDISGILTWGSVWPGRPATLEDDALGGTEFVLPVLAMRCLVGGDGTEG
jgi:hypothetical protein